MLLKQYEFHFRGLENICSLEIRSLFHQLRSTLIMPNPSQKDTNIYNWLYNFVEYFLLASLACFEL